MNFYARQHAHSKNIQTQPPAPLEWPVAETSEDSSGTTSWATALSSHPQMVWDGVWAWQPSPTDSNGLKEMKLVVNGTTKDGQSPDHTWVVELRMPETVGALTRMLGEAVKKSIDDWTFEMRYVPVSNSTRYIWQARTCMGGKVRADSCAHSLGLALARLLLITWSKIKTLS